MTANVPYVPVAELALYDRVSPVSGSEAPTVLLAVDVDASSVTAPVWSAPADGASLMFPICEVNTVYTVSVVL